MSSTFSNFQNWTLSVDALGHFFFVILLYLNLCPKRFLTTFLAVSALRVDLRRLTVVVERKN